MQIAKYATPSFLSEMRRIDFPKSHIDGLDFGILNEIESAGEDFPAILRGLSASLYLSKYDDETIRRRVEALIAKGYISKAARGLSLTPSGKESLDRFRSTWIGTITCEPVTKTGVLADAISSSPDSDLGVPTIGVVENGMTKMSTVGIVGGTPVRILVGSVLGKSFLESRVDPSERYSGSDF